MYKTKYNVSIECEQCGQEEAVLIKPGDETPGPVGWLAKFYFEHNHQSDSEEDKTFCSQNCYLKFFLKEKEKSLKEVYKFRMKELEEKRVKHEEYRKNREEEKDA